MVNLETFLQQLSPPLVGDSLFAQLPDVVYFIKDIKGRYISANKAYADKLNLRSANDIIGKTADDLFPEYLASSYNEQDKHIFATGDDMLDRLEVMTNRGRLGWYLASKFPLYNKEGKIVGLVSLSRDLFTPCDEDLRFAGIAKVVTFIQNHYADNINATSLASKVNLTVPQLDRRMKKVFKLSTSQFIRKTRITAATVALRKTTKQISQVAQECGYSDQSAFTRQFSATVGMTPGVYRSKSLGFRVAPMKDDTEGLRSLRHNS